MRHSITQKTTAIWVLIVCALGMGFILWPDSDTNTDTDTDSRSFSEAIFGPDVPDFSSFSQVSEKKQAFFDYFRPLIEAENERIRTLRDRIQSLRQQSKLREKQHQWLVDLGKEYRLRIDPPIRDSDYTALLKRIDVLPSSLVLSQAAIESAWGTSRFARKGYNYFGQWCFTEGCGMVPRARASQASHEVKTFDSPRAAIASYFKNINSHPAYRILREQRYLARQESNPIHGCTLAAGLEDYSARGVHYINEIRQMIRVNDLTPHSQSPCRSLRTAKSKQQVTKTDQDAGYMAGDSFAKGQETTTATKAPDTTLRMEAGASSSEKTSENAPKAAAPPKEPYNSTGNGQTATTAGEPS